MDLDQYSNEQLELELKHRAEAAKFAAEKKRLAHQEYIIEHIDVFLGFVREHGRTSCSDKDAANYARGRCVRCALLRAKKDQCFYDDVDFELWIKSYHEDA